MTCCYCKQEIKAGDTHGIERNPTAQELKECPDVAVFLVCNVKMFVDMPSRIGRMDGITNERPKR
jgi:hypothetical protein